ncbi:MAG TPA: bifunctional nuclease domain-containing protein [Candidatus Dormibacteraeota bacterium]|nr:bifunctional nuclease domain-containing protein [Candidatus Dormibacteraeota bacterium]
MELLPIGRFAKQAGLTIHQLRHYHEIGLLEPAFVDSESGYRYYSPAQAARAEAISLLRSLDMPITDIQRLLQDPAPETVSLLLARHRERLESRLAQVEERLRLIDALTRQRRLNMIPEPSDVVEVRVESVQQGAEGRRHVVLAEVDGSRRVPIWIGPSEASSIDGHLKGVEAQRPTTYDLMSAALQRFDLTVTRATVTHIEDCQTFYARLHVRSGDREEVLDARPSDAVSLALRTGAPIYASASLLQAPEATA